MFLNQFFQFSYPSKKPFFLVMLHFPAISAEKRGKMLQKQNGEEKKMSEINWYNDNIYRLLIFIIFRSLMMVWPATAEHHFVMFDPWSALRQYFNTVLFYSCVFCTPEVKHTEALLLQIEWRTVGIRNHLLVYYSRSLLPHREDSEKRRITRWPFSTLLWWQR